MYVYVCAAYFLYIKVAGFEKFPGCKLFNR